MRFFACALAAILLFSAGPAAAGTLRIGTVGDYPPFNYIDEAGELTGFDVDIARALCAEMEVRCLFQLHPWPVLIPELRAGTFDAIVASMSITEERRRLVAFTDRYYSNVSRFVTSEAPHFHPERPAGMVIGAMRDTIASDWLEENVGETARIRLYDSKTEVLDALRRAQVDAVFGDLLGLHAWLNSHDGASFRFIGKGLHLDRGIGIAVRQEDEDLRLRINESLETILADGTYRRINARYFPFSIY